MGGTDRNRHYSRVKWRSRAIVTARSTEIRGPVLNISLNGVLVETERDLEPHAPCNVRIPLGGDPEQAILASGHVVRREEKGLAIRFEAMDVDSAAHLRQLTTLNSEDPVRADHEAVHLRLSEGVDPSAPDPSDY